MATPRECFAELAARPDAEIDLTQGALLIAAESCPGLDVDACRERLQALGDAARASVANIASQSERVDALNHFLFQEQGFGANDTDYRDPRSSFLPDVLERRTGLPIALALVYLEVARASGVQAAGVGFPGHFLVRTLGPEPMVIDPFYGRVLDDDEIHARLQAALGEEAELSPEHLRPATPREILVRVLTNLKHLHVQAERWDEALACSERILLLVPDLPSELRDRGLIFAKLECFTAALADLERVEALLDSTPSALTRMIEHMRDRVQSIH